jgi:pimeloyl-ACP methyl ester carboxylesterase
MQEAFFFPSGGHQLYGVFYPPQGRASGRGIVLCNAFGLEFLLSLSHMTNLARQLASRGHAVIRFDYRGYADSAGAFEDATISGMCQDIESAIDELQRRAEIDHLSLLGLRFGALLATLVAARRREVRRLLLWEPVAKAWDYLYAELRHTVTMQMVLFKEIHATRDQIVDNILNGRPTQVGGYNLNCIDEGFTLAAELIRESREVDLLTAPPALAADVTLMNIRAKQGRPPKALQRIVEALQGRKVDCCLETVIEPCIFWKYGPFYATRSDPLFAATEAALVRAPLSD